ncbi:MAG: hypothetical protein QXV16_00330 [Candidatus Anstonellales archaeon]
MTIEQLKKPSKEIKIEKKEINRGFNIDSKSKQKMEELMTELAKRQSFDKEVMDRYINSKREIDAEIVERMGFKDFEEFRYEMNSIFKDSKYKDLMKKIGEKFPELALLLNRKGNLLLNYYIIKYVLPYLFAGGMSKKKILEIVEMLLDRMVIYPNFKNFFKKLEEFLKKYATPDGEAVKIFISSESWR